MATLDQLIDMVHLNLAGSVEDQEQLTVLAADITPTTMSFNVGDASQVSTGLIEIGDELMWCSGVDPDSNLVTVILRGMYAYDDIGVAADHTSGTIVRNSPKHPRNQTRRVINETILQLYPDLFAVSSTTLDSNPVQMTYALPNDVESVYEVSYRSIGPSGLYPEISRYKVNLTAAVGKSIDIFQGVAPGAQVLVNYRKRPQALASIDFDFSNSGLPAAAQEVVIYGACAALVGYLEPSRVIAGRSAEAKLLDPANNPPGAATNAAQYFYQMFMLTKAQVAKQLQIDYPTRINWNR